eukprot:6199519-Pleurochrysis_carterae.AAC.2
MRGRGGVLQTLNRSASTVADETTRCRSSLRFSTFFRSPKSTSVWSERSCASSTMITEYRDSSGSRMVSAMSIPSVQ